MAHTDKILDTDKHFEIDPITRAIKNQSPSKVSVMQYDHNSERFTFTLPKSIEGHDMTECNRIEVHYINTDSATKESNTGLYEVSDLAVSPEDENILTCSWLVSQNATQKVGALSFLLRFACVDAEGNVEYAWNTGIFKGIHVSSGMYNSEIIVEQYADVLEQWKNELNTGGGGGGVSQEYVDNALLPKIAAYEKNKDYHVGDWVIGQFYNPSKNVNETMILQCKKDCKSSSASYPSVDTDCWTMYSIRADKAHKDINNNIIHETYATKEEVPTVSSGQVEGKYVTRIYFTKRNEYDQLLSGNVLIPAYTSDLQNDSGFVTREDLGDIETGEKVYDYSSETTKDLVLEHNSLYYFGVLTTLRLAISSDVNIESVDVPFECSIMFTSGETATNLDYSASPIIWSGDDCDSDGHFVPEANKTYEISIKKFGLTISARVGVI